MRIRMIATVVMATLFCSPAARAHLRLTTPAARHTQSAVGDPQKAGPCGVGGAADVRGSNVTVYEPGQEIVVEWTETVPHPGHFRILFDPNGQDFPDPKAYDDYTAGGSKTLADNIPHPASGSKYRQTVKLPNVECDRCTLQVLQVMTDKPPFGPGGGVDFYWHCADITLARSPAADAAIDDAGPPADGSVGADAGETTDGDGLTPVPTTTDSGGCRVARAASPSIALTLSLLALAGVSRRRLRRG